jgi:hypothetical protein
VRARRIATAAAVVILAVWFPLVSAFAQTDGPDYVGATPPSTAVSAAVATPVSHGPNELPRTGVDIGAMALAGVGLVVVGRALMGRRTKPDTSS